MNQREAVIEVMKENGGFATLGHLYSEALKIPKVEWNTKTPFASIRRIVQNEDFFFKIRPGLWALKEYKHRTPFDEASTTRASREKQSEFNHTYYQGLLVELGNLERYQTFVPSQDKNKRFRNQSLAKLTTISRIYDFSYNQLVRRAQTIDVIWFSKKKFPLPSYFFEIEHSTHFQNSLEKFVDLQDFNVTMCIVADNRKKREYQSKLSFSVFEPIAQRVKFLDYETISNWHAKTVELNLARPQL